MTQQGESMHYRVNAPNVIAETVGGETIIVDLATGHYFNLQGSAVEVWSGVESAQSVPSLVRTLEQRYEADGDTIRQAVESFLDELEGAGLIVADGAAEAEPAEPRSFEGERGTFTAPSFTRFTDMQDIILLDPVHEVDATGWPNVAAAS